MDAQQRKNSVAWLSVISNTALVLGKLIIGVLIGSVSVISEAIHSSMDLIAAVIAFFSVRISDTPADERHPYGHGKFENISGVLEALLIFVATLLATLFGLVVGVNPMLTGRPIGGVFFNLVLLGYGIPALLAAILALIARNSRPLAYRAIAATTAVSLALMYLGLEVRALFHGEFLTRGTTTDAEQYTYSAVWLAFGVLLLIAEAGRGPIRNDRAEFVQCSLQIDVL